MKINTSAFKKARESRLLGIHHLAKSADVSPGCVKGLENGTSPRLDTLRKIIAALGMTVEEAYEKKFIEE
ncbi:MAG: helix-turn-helix domain-containing protein [Deltaproteobacteria bacterium]|jgi:DNA-binding XRE family transcriptional regulator|nr:helix-turn-helix domain-containing protein [Deltaproteobacteria bacterium]